jgi:hypothetical protein
MTPNTDFSYGRLLLRLSSIITNYWQSSSSQNQIQSYLRPDGQSASPSWCQFSIRDPRPIFLSLSWKLSWHLQFSNMMWPLWREDGFVLSGCCWASPALTVLGPSPADLVTILYCLNFEIPPTRRGMILYLLPQEHGGPVQFPSIESD